MGTSNLFGINRSKLVFSLPVKTDTPSLCTTPVKLSTKKEDVPFGGESPSVLTPTTETPPIPKSGEALNSGAFIEITSEPPSSRVYLDNNLHGLTPTSVFVLDGDIAHIRVSHKGYRSVKLKAKAGDEFHARLEHYSKNSKVHKR